MGVRPRPSLQSAHVEEDASRRNFISRPPAAAQWRSRLPCLPGVAAAEWLRRHLQTSDLPWRAATRRGVSLSLFAAFTSAPAWRSALAVFRCPLRDARWRGPLPSAVEALTSLPCARRSLTHSNAPTALARCRGVCLALSQRDTSAPCWKRYSMHASCRCTAVVWSALCPPAFWAFTSLLASSLPAFSSPALLTRHCSSIAWIISTLPCLAARWRGVLPSASRAKRSSPSPTRNSPKLVSYSAHQWSAVLPSASLLLSDAPLSMSRSAHSK
mmetsp:Transcript_7816/g.32890  ORF Transcript_7816/g.32890 Transcript_7816/m.32890 type:complete len:271 (+) Transcript_7816:587-1399(+)